MFLNQHNESMAHFFTDETWVARLDIFNILNSLNLSWQKDWHRRSENAWQKSMPSRRNCAYGREDVKKAPMICFRCWLTFLQWTIFRQASLQAPFWTTYSSCRITFISTSATTMSAHLIWIGNPFECELTDLTGREQEQLAELSSDRTLRLQLSRLTLLSFWLACFQEYSLLSDKAINVLLPFSTTYLCETAFSAVTAMKTKYRSRLDIEHEIRIFLSRIPQFAARAWNVCGVHSIKKVENLWSKQQWVFFLHRGEQWPVSTLKSLFWTAGRL